MPRIIKISINFSIPINAPPSPPNGEFEGTSVKEA